MAAKSSSSNPTNRLPTQRLSYSKKKANDFQWAKDSVDALSTDRYDLDARETLHTSDRKRKIVNYRLYNNQIEQKDLERDCNIFNIDEEMFKDEIQPYNKAYNKINTLLGEELRRHFNFRAFLVNPEAVDTFNEEKTALLRDYLISTTVNTINKTKGVQEESENVKNPEQIEKYMTTNWREASEIATQQLLEYYVRFYDIKTLKNDGFKHSLIAGEEFAWIGMENNQPVIRMLNPIKTFYHKSPEVKFIQDGMYAGYRTRMTVADVLDTYGDAMKEKDKESLDRNYYQGGGKYGIRPDLINKNYDNKGLNKSFEWWYGNTYLDSEGSYGYSYDDDIEVIHVEWKSQRKVGFREDEEGNVDLIDESYKVPATANRVSYKDSNGNRKTKYEFVDEQGIPVTIEWKWIPEVWEGTRIAGDIYVNLRPKPFQYRDIDNPFDVKLGYHGLIFNAMNAPNISLMDRMKPFQYLYFITMHKMKQILAADAPPLVNVDMSMIPKRLTNAEYMYYYKIGINFYDSTQNMEGGAQLSGQKGTYEVGRSVMQHVANYVSILENLDQQISEVAGISPQREGQVSQYETTTGTQTSIVNSGHVTEQHFVLHNLLWEKILTSFVETVQVAYKSRAIKIPYVLDDLSRAVIDIKPSLLQNKKLGVFISDDARDHEALSNMRQLSLEMMQNGHKASDVMKLYRATSAEAWQREMEQLEKQREAMEQAMRQYEAEAAERAAQMQIDNREDEQSHEIDKINLQGEWDLKKTALTALGFDEDKDRDKDSVPDVIEQMERMNKIQVANREQDRKDKELAQKKELEEKKIKVQREKKSST